MQHLTRRVRTSSYCFSICSHGCLYPSQKETLSAANFPNNRLFLYSSVFHHRHCIFLCCFRTIYFCIITLAYRRWKTDTATPEAKTTWSVSCSATTISTITDYSKRKSCLRYRSLFPFFFFLIKFGCSKRIIQMIPESFSPKQLSDDWNLVPLPQCYCYSFLV